MAYRCRYRLAAAALTAVIMGLTGCARDIDLLKEASYPTNGDIFLNGFSAGLDYQAFANSKVDAFEMDAVDTYTGSHAMKITVPGAGDPSGWFAGGAFIANPPRDLSGYNALTFWAKASMVATVGLVGFGNDNTGASVYTAWQTDLTVSTIWKKYIIPIPLPEKLTAEQGMFEFAAGADAAGNGYYLWFDEVQFEKLGTIAHPRPQITSNIVTAAEGDTISIGDITVRFDINGVDEVVKAMPGYLDYSADSDTVVAIDGDIIRVIGEGSTVIRGKMGDVDAAGTITVNVGTASGPAGPAAAPTRAANDVISLFSDVYTDHAVSSFSAEWDAADLSDILIAGDAVKLYTNLSFAGIDFSSSTIDASEMTTFHMDIWTPDQTSPPTDFNIKLVDFGADGAYGGGDDVEYEVALTESTTPAIASGTWVGLDLPLADFTGLTTRGHLAQIVLSGGLSTVYVDNIYFYKGSGGTGSEPSSAAPVPGFSADDVVSLFSDEYTNITVDTWSALWDDADIADVQIAGDNVKYYTNLVYAGIECTSEPFDVSGLTHFYMNIWTPDPTASPAIFKIKLVDFGSNGVWNGGGDDVEHELVFTAASTPALTTGSWITFDIPLSDFTGLVTKSHMAQIIFTADPGPNHVYMDNLLFHK